LDKILIPVNIKNMTYEQQCKYVISPEASLFRKQAIELYGAMYKANYNIKKGSCANAFNVNWNSSNDKFTIGGKSLSHYYGHYIGSSQGFTGLLTKIIEWSERQKYVCDLKRNGKYCRPGDR
jgi:hypothetical protein